MFDGQEEACAGKLRPNVAISILIAILFLTVVPGSVVDTSLSQDTREVTLSPIEALEMLKFELERAESELLGDTHNAPTLLPNIPLAPYPEISPDGRPMGSEPPLPQSTPYWQNMSSPPNNTGGGYSYDTRSSLGEYQVGGTHELYVGDQNGNGLVEWISYYYHRPSSINGLDDDGDGCVDELTYGNSTGQTGCDTVPDAMVYFETGTSAFLGGSNGDLIMLVDYFTGEVSFEIFKIGVSPKWMGYRVRGTHLYARIVGDYISYYASEKYTNTNANPEMDNDREDYYVGSIDVRLFPVRPPTNHVCSAGDQIPVGGATHMRYDGWIVGAYNLVETYDQHDWNGDGDIADKVLAYYAVNPITGSCRQGVNTGVAGVMPISRGTIITTMYTGEIGDNRDWNNDSDLMGPVSLYHNVNSTWQMKGRMYASFTFTAPVPQWGFGWSAVYDNDVSATWRMPLEFGGVFYRYIGPPYLYKSYLWLTSDEDGDRHTTLPEYEIGYGQPGGTFGGRCAIVYAREQNLGVDVTGDGDIWDTVNGIFCPNETGGGGVWASKGPVIAGKQTPWEFQGFYYFRLTDYTIEDSQGRVAMPFFVCEGLTEGCTPVDLDGDDKWSSPYYSWIHLSYLFKMP